MAVIRSNLRAILTERHITPRHLGALIGITPSNIYSLLKEPEKVYLPTLAAVCEYLGVGIEDILKLEDVSPRKDSSTPR